MIVAALVVIALTAAAEVWSHVVQREAEEELIFRGNQYVEAIRIHMQRHGRQPLKLDDLMKTGPGKPRCIRRLYEDPITRSEKWGLIFADGRWWPPQPVPAGGTPLPGQPTQPGQSPGGLSGLQESEIEFTSIGSPLDEGSAAPAGPIVGVFSTSRDESIREYNGRRHYNEWEFSLLQQGQQGGVGQAPGGGRPMPGQGGGNPPGTGGGGSGGIETKP